ncbi:MAG: PAC2 family protein [Candidatus Nitrosocaldus sp.]|nr:PAC2 family protein [Candidatus Nitrosocaldus sp.]MDW8275434.1 PAC2 family protein [Candidatus Nitrosocaldus sp.]
MSSSMHEYIKTVYFERPRLNSPYMICGFPGSGYVGKLAVEHLVQELNAKPLADIYSYSFPPQVVIRQDGTVELMKSSIYYWQRGMQDVGSSSSSSSSSSSGDGIYNSSIGSNDLLLLTADAQPLTPEGEHLLAEIITDIAVELNTRMVFTLAAYITGVFMDKPRVYATATDASLIEEFRGRGMATMDNGSITGMNGLLIGMARLKGIKGVCLLAETSGYVVDAKASQAVLRSLLEFVNMSVDMSSLEKRAKDTEMIIKALEQQVRRSGMGGITQEQLREEQDKDRDLGYIS